MRVIGTAGHVDHGKSALVKALTGINPDRLKEEQEREMTIDLGFAWMTLPSGQAVSLVDVPGHEAFIKNMLAGVGGIDAALLVIAADEGIMPQTREHLAILDLLRVKGGVVALTKSDLAREPGWLEMVEAEVAHALRDTVLAGASIVAVSAKTGRGLDVLRRELDRTLAEVVEKTDRARPRLPIDRVFTLAGFGTVVTGTLDDGSFGVGDEVEIAPRGLRARIRGLQTHKEKIARAAPGGRVAINLAGIATDELARGDVVIRPGTYRPTQILDARLQWLPDAPKPLRHSQRLELFVFSSETSVRVRLLEGERVEAGQSAWVQLISSAPLVLAKGDRFILRYASPSQTVGGGVVIEPHPLARYRRGRSEVIERLERAQRGTPTELIMQYVEMNGALDARELPERVGLEPSVVALALRELIDAGELITLNHERAEYLVSRASWNEWCARARVHLDKYHREFPLRAGIPREVFKTRLPSLPPRIFDSALERAAREQVFEFNEKSVWAREHRAEFDPALEARVEALLADFERAPYSPPSAEEASAAIGAEALNALVEQGQLVRLSASVLLTSAAERAMMAWVIAAIHARGQVTAAELRDQFGTSRKYAIAFLEYLDQKHVTRRVGDGRVLHPHLELTRAAE